MKNILVPTDFSENADKALDFALALANKFGATLHLIHAYHSTGHAGHLANVNRVIKEDRDKEMETFLAETKASLSFDVEIKGRCRKGHPLEIIRSEVENVEAELVIMGTLGASNIGKKVMGSTASKLIKNLSTPILAIPQNISYTDMENLVLAVDATSMKSPRTLNPMLSLAQKMKLNIELVHVSGNELHTDIDPSIQSYLTDSAIPFSYTKVQSDDVLEGILTFAHDKGNSLLCLVSHQRSWFNNLFHNSVSQQVALQSDLPILVVRNEVA